ncbi:MBL fold metallo-hydrolase [uncultured Tateyamaria sp.]|uniref:MBL fold metallo-hydrolase n=1 Tax=uncultured Tateyamaria sp. TaxID=455651 RepID=UPI0026344F00|nr:MBL fold metallo-hydrolase [uncultured Tateyamaria sp.]
MVKLNRRSLLLQGGAAAAASLSVFPKVTSASVGQATLTTVSDGNLILPGDFIFEPMPQDGLKRVLADFGISHERLTPECNLALYRDGERTVLFDVGSGPDFMPTAGTVLESLNAVGLSPEDVTDVVFTHAHPDHIWGLIDEFDDPLFYNATYRMGRAEWDYWWDPDTVNTIGDARAAFAVGAKRRMEVIEDSVVFFEDGQEILPGIAAVSSPGHTPGHMSFELRNGSDSALVLGDAIGNHHVAFRKPDWISGADQDGDLAAATRAVLFDRIMSEQMQIVGFHLPEGGMGRVDRDAEGYVFLPGAA